MRATTVNTILLLAATLWTVDARAQDAGVAKSDAATRWAEAIAPFVDEQTLFVAHVDLAAIDVQATADALVKFVGIPKEAFGDAAGQALVAAKLAKVGATDVYFVFGLADIPSPGFLVIRGKPGIDANWIAQVVAQLSPAGRAYEGVCEPLHGSVFLGGKESLERLKQSKPASRPELAKALAAAGDTAAQVLFLLSDDSRRVVRELFPRLPVELGGGPTTPLVDGFLWAVAGLELPPKKPSIRLIVQSQDAAAAKAFQTSISGLYPKLIDLLVAALERRIDMQPVAHNIRDKADKIAPLLTPQVEGDRLLLNLSEANGGLEALATMIRPPVEIARLAAQRARSVNNLKQIGLAMHNYYDTKKSLPAAASYDKDGKRLSSWRVQLLPYLEQEGATALYKEFHLDEPWDSEHNRKLIDRMPAVFRSPLAQLQDPGRTTYLLPVDSKHFIGGREIVKPSKPGSSPPDEPNALFFGGPKGGTFNQITDGTSNTIMIVEADEAHAVIWTRPDDLTVELDDPVRGLENKATGGFNTAFFDGSVQFFPNTIPKKTLRTLFTPAGREVVNWPN